MLRNGYVRVILTISIKIYLVNPKGMIQAFVLKFGLFIHSAHIEYMLYTKFYDRCYTVENKADVVTQSSQGWMRRYTLNEMYTHTHTHTLSRNTPRMPCLWRIRTDCCLCLNCFPSRFPDYPFPSSLQASTQMSPSHLSSVWFQVLPNVHWNVRIIKI